MARKSRYTPDILDNYDPVSAPDSPKFQMTEGRTQLLQEIIRDIPKKNVEPEPYTPMLITDNPSKEEMNALVEKMRIGGMRAVDKAIQRGRFTFSDVEAITAALAVMVLHPSANRQVLQISSAVGQHMDRLIKLIQARETVEINEETADRIKQIEAALMELTND